MRRKTAFHLMAKPVGPICNLDCKYCFYLEKTNYFPANEHYRMADGVLESYIRQYIESQDVSQVDFAWQGGEPTLAGVDFFRKAVALQKKYANGKRITNGFQTNGVLLDSEWCEFLGAEDFLIGLSIDGPPRLHDYYRIDKQQEPTFERVMRGLDLLKKYNVEFNTLTVVSRKNGDHPLKVYRFLKSIGSQYMQFIPLIERKVNPRASSEGLDYATPPDLAGLEDFPVTSFSVLASQFGQFLTSIFDEWMRKDVGSVFVNYFDNALASWLGVLSSMCVFRETCGQSLILEHDGSVYSCDHFMYPEYKLGSIQITPMRELVNSPQQETFGEDKATKLPAYCFNCEVRFACNGECPKHRFIQTPDGEPGLNYLCAGLKHFFTHIDPKMRQMANLLRQSRPASEIMQKQK